MDEPEESEPIRWRRDATTSRTVRILWSLGAGTFFAAIGIIVFWRLFDLAGQAGAGSVIVAVAAAVVATILAIAVAGRNDRWLEGFADRLPLEIASGRTLRRAIDAAVGTVAVAALMVVLMAIGRYVSRRELLEVGAGPFTGLAALLIPLALVALVLSSFLRSVGALDREERTIYLFEPDQAVDLEVIEDVSVRRLGDAAIVRLRYAEPDGQYVPGPRRIVVPPAVAREITSLVRRESVRAE